MVPQRKKISKKGVINLVEMITVVVILFIAFSVFFPGFVYKSRWNDAYVVLLSRDTIITIDRLGKLYNFSFSASSLQKYLDLTLPTNKTNLIGWSEVDGVIKNQLTIACNCTEQQISTLSELFSGLQFNGREVQVLIPKSSLEVINQPADVLLIWGYKNLDPYAQNIKNFLASENGVVEIMDFSDITQVNNDRAQREIFGLQANSIATSDELSDNFARAPSNSSDIIYGPFKFFYHIPLALKTIPNTSASIPSEIPIDASNCANFTQGNITFNKTSYKFWDCTSIAGALSVYFDTNANGKADTRLVAGESFNLTNIASYNFTLSYIDGMRKIGVAFRANFTFDDFGNFAGTKVLDVVPRDGSDKTLLKTSPGNFPVVILNRTAIARAAWIADFSEDGYGDDEKQLLMSLILWASNKKAARVLSPNIRAGLLTSYINTVNQDMFEVYRFNLGLGFPFGR